MKLTCILTVTVVAGLITAVSSCPDCCAIHVVLDTSTEWSPADPCSCNITVDQLSQLESYLDRNTTISCPQREFLFQSGIHRSYNSSSFIFESVQSIVIRGVPNTTIRCQNVTFCVIFDSAEVLLIRDVHIVNCSCSQYWKWEGHFWGKSRYIPVSATIKIRNSKFTNSRLLLQHRKICEDCLINLDAIVMIKNITVENCCDSVESNEVPTNIPFLCAYTKGFVYTFKSLLNFILENIIFRNNRFPFIKRDNYYARNTSEISITLTGHCILSHNKGVGIIDTKSFRAKTSIIISTAVVYITSNTHVYDYHTWSCPAPITIGGGVILTFEHCHVVFSDNYGECSGGIAIGGTVVFNDNVLIEFSNNVGEHGGALNMGDSLMIFNATESSIELVFINNSARVGGAIWFDVGDFFNITPNFVLQCSTELVSLNFLNNSAILGGNDIYGGWVGWFKGEDDLIAYKLDLMKEILNLNSDDDSDFGIASCPVRICMCTDGHPNCNVNELTIEVYGYAFNLDLIAMGESFTPVPARVEIWRVGETMLPGNFQTGYLPGDFEDQCIDHPTDSLLQAACTNILHVGYYKQEILSFKSMLDDDCEGLKSEFSEPNYNTSDSTTARAMILFQQLSVVVNYNDCPMGFIISKINHRCVCQRFILSLGLNCDDTEVMIRRNKHQWVSIAHEHHHTSSENPGVIVYPYCPFDYCRTDNKSLLIRLEGETDHELCAFNRSGILCGGCKSNYSRVLGSSMCKVCSINFKMFAIILGWLLSGLILVILLILLDLTVSVGTINGLIFYANIIRAQRATFFTSNVSTPFLSKFIAWLNLDQGFETCFYNGLDEYTITWLQFLFPLYIWLIAAAMIVSSHHSTRISKLIGNNAVQVMATIFFITYTKFLRFTVIEYPDGFKKTVWLVDGNVDYFKGKHIPLILVTIIFVLLYVSYTFILLTIQFPLLRVQKLKPLFDAYTVPYRDNHRYWTGLLLIARIILLTIFHINYRNDISLNLFVIVLISFGLVGWLGVCRWVYEYPLNNFLEVVFLSNLGLTSVAVYFEKGNTVAINISTILALTMFIAIILYHLLRQLLLTRCGLELKKRLTKNEEEATICCESIGQPISDGKRTSEVTYSVVSIDLNEPLLECK